MIYVIFRHFILFVHKTNMELFIQYSEPMRYCELDAAGRRGIIENGTPNIKKNDDKRI